MKDLIGYAVFILLLVLAWAVLKTVPVVLEGM